MTHVVSELTRVHVGSVSAHVCLTRNPDRESIYTHNLQGYTLSFSIFKAMGRT
jgi:hypothetical protein